MTFLRGMVSLVIKCQERNEGGGRGEGGENRVASYFDIGPGGDTLVSNLNSRGKNNVVNNLNIRGDNIGSDLNTRG